MPHESQYVQYYRGQEVRRVVNRMEHVRVPPWFEYANVIASLPYVFYPSSPLVLPDDT